MQAIRPLADGLVLYGVRHPRRGCFLLLRTSLGGGIMPPLPVQVCSISGTRIMSTVFRVAFLAASFSSFLLAGCATTTDQEEPTAAVEPGTEEVLAALNVWKAALEAQSVAQVVPCYSDQFQHPEYGDKAGVRSYFEEAKLDGYLEGLQVDSSAAAIAFDAGRAVIQDIRLNGKFGALLYRLILANEQGSWRIVGTDASPL